jgi:NADPH2:quinone reductase
MRALRLLEHNRVHLVVDAPNPQAASGEEIIEVAVVGINPLDVVIAKGLLAGDASLPRTLGVEAVGYLRGKPVVVHGAGVGIRRDGTLGERVAAPEIAIIPVPDNVPLEVAAACGITGATAIRLVQLAEAKAGDRAVVLGASGAVGSAVCSLLATARITTWGQIRRQDAQTFVKNAGAIPLLADSPKRIASALGGERPTIIFDCLGGEWMVAAAATLANDGRHVIYGTTCGAIVQLNLIEFYRRGGTMRGYRGVLEPPARLREAVELALAAVAQGRMRIPIATPIKFSSAKHALEQIARSHEGKILVEINE